MKRLVAAACTALAFAPLASLGAADAALGSTLEGLLEYARNNPEYAAMQSEATAASERVYPAGAFPDPTFRVELMDITNAGMEQAPSLLPSKVGGTKYTLMQMIPWWGKRDLKRGVAEADLAQAQGKVAATWAEIASAVKTMYARYYLAVESEALSQEVLDLMNQLERVARARYESGLVPQQDVIRAQVEVTSMRSDLLMLESDRAMAASGLNAMLGRDPLAPLARPNALPALPAPAKLDAATLIERLRARAPEIFVEDARVIAAQKNKDLTFRNRFPDITAGIAPTQTGSKIGEWELMFEVSIPLQQKSRRHQEAEAQSMLDAARQRRQAVANRLIGDLQQNLAALQAAQRIDILTTNSLLPQADATLQSALVGYENGKVDFATLVDAQRAIRKAKIDRLKAQVDAQTRRAAIEKILGEDL